MEELFKGLKYTENAVELEMMTWELPFIFLIFGIDYQRVFIWVTGGKRVGFEERIACQTCFSRRELRELRRVGFDCIHIFLGFRFLAADSGTTLGEFPPETAEGGQDKSDDDDRDGDEVHSDTLLLSFLTCRGITGLCLGPGRGGGCGGGGGGDW